MFLRFARSISSWWSRPTASALAVSLLGVVTLWAQNGGLDDARRRWNELPDERRRELAERYENWRRMSDEDRARLRERWRSVENMRHHAREALPEKARGELSRLPWHEQRDALAGLVSEQIGERGRSMLERLPPEWRERLERATPEQKRELFERFKGDMRSKALRKLDEIATRLDLSTEEVERLRKVDSCELGRRLMELEGRAFRAGVERRGLPAFVSAEQWSQWKDLPPDQMWRRFHDAERDCRPRGDSERDGRGERDPRFERAHRLREVLRPEPSWFIELAGLPPETKAEQLSARMRGRLLDHLRAQPEGLNAQQIAELERHEGRAFFEALQKVMPELQPPWSMRDKERGKERGRDERGNKSWPRGGGEDRKGPPSSTRPGN